MGTGSGVVSVAVGELGTELGEVAGRGAGRSGAGRGWARALPVVSIPDIPRRIPTPPTEDILVRIHIVFSILLRAKNPAA
jgi:hypothetical protein